MAASCATRGVTKTNKSRLNNQIGNEYSYKTSGYNIFTVHGFILSSFSSISEQLLEWLLIKDWYQHKAPHVIKKENEIHELSKHTMKETNLLFPSLFLLLLMEA